MMDRIALIILAEHLHVPVVNLLADFNLHVVLMMIEVKLQVHYAYVKKKHS